MLVPTPGALDALRTMGWEADEASGNDELVVRAGLTYTMKDVRVVEDAKDRLKKEMRASATATARLVATQA